MTKPSCVEVNDFPEYEVCADATFDTPRGNFHFSPDVHSGELVVEGPLDAEGVIMHYMAGYERPTMRRVVELMREISSISEKERGFFHELFEQLTPGECDAFMRSTSSSAREMASLMRTCQVRRAVIVKWVNQYASDPNWREDNMLAIVYGDRWTNVRGHIVPRAHAESIRKNLARAGIGGEN